MPPGTPRPHAAIAGVTPGRDAGALTSRARAAIAGPPARAVVPRPRRRPLPPPPRVRGRRPFPLGILAAALVFVGLFCVGAGLGTTTGFDLREVFRGPDKPPPRAFPVLEPSPPVRLTIPAINVRAPILEVGLAADGSVDVPPVQRHREAGWFRDGPTPGQFGPALIVGHADTRTGPSVFHDLDRMQPGQRIEVLRRDRRVAVFEVNSIEHFAKSRLPVDRVYGDYSRPQLRLVTCGGRWLGGTRGYSDNVVVFASLVATRGR
ncbi:class F sortase [Krasilnikovia sp. MM14-A1004]|uniref:class F sortase n=1 Tax=Krasilnikovia sp. MM14-A1004 TaxID=3373541 RepID=UPI00399CDCBB